MKWGLIECLGLMMEFNLEIRFVKVIMKNHYLIGQQLIFRFILRNRFVKSHYPVLYYKLKEILNY